MKSLSVYTVHINAKETSKQGDIDKVIILKEGFSFMAFIFHFFWLAYKRVWIPAAVVFVAFTLLGSLERSQILVLEQGIVLQLGLMLYVGFSAHDWLRKSLEIRGYTFAGVVTARDDVEAYQRFFDRYMHPKPQHVTSGNDAVVVS